MSTAQIAAFTSAQISQGLSTDQIAALSTAQIAALRTAQIVAADDGARKVFETNHLVPDADPQEIIDEINSNFAAFQQIILVGHEPFLSGLISKLISGGADVSIEMKKGALCKLSLESLAFDKCARLEWLLTSRQLARCGRGDKD